MTKYPQEQIIEYFDIVREDNFEWTDTDEHAVYYEYTTTAPEESFEFKVTIDTPDKECYFRRKGNEDWLHAFTVEEE
jgi:hypothetical protein